MANFKVGDRVRFVSRFSREGDEPEGAAEMLGREGTITARGEPDDLWDWYVYVPGCPIPVRAGDDLLGDTVFADSCMLAPLTDPKAQEIIDAANKILAAPVGPVHPAPVFTFRERAEKLNTDELPALREVMRHYSRAEPVAPERITAEWQDGLFGFRATP